jgi:hypothetical protein
MAKYGADKGIVVDRAGEDGLIAGLAMVDPIDAHLF